MVDPFQLLDNGNTLSGTNENQILLRLKQNMNEESTNLRICNEPTDHATNDEEKKTIDFDGPGDNAASDDDDQSQQRQQQQQQSGPDNVLKKMGVPLNHQSYELNHMPYHSNKSKKNEQNFDNADKQSEYCVSDEICESGALDADADFLIANPVVHGKLMDNEQLTKHFELNVSSSSSSSSLNLSDTDPTVQHQELLVEQSPQQQQLTPPPSSTITTTPPSTAAAIKCNSINSSNSSNLPDNCVNLNSNESTTNMETINNYDSPTSTTNDAQETDNRRVEPLKINLHREPIKTIIKIPKHVPDETIPKITIKSIKLPHTGGDEDVPKHTLIVDSSISTSSSSSSSSNQNCSSDPPSEAHVIPKLTIRNSANSFGIAGQSEIVPKLTIKMDQNHIASTQVNSKDKTITSDDGIKLTIKPILEPPIPKLTIKTNSNDCAEVVNSTTAKFSINVGPSSPSSSTAGTNKLNRVVNPSKSESIVPKIKITKMGDPLGEVPQFAIAKLDDVVNAREVNVVKTVPKLVVKLPKEVDSEQSNKSKTYDESDTSESTVDEIVPKITIRQVKQLELTTNENIIIPKVTIKPIINPNNETTNESETLVTPKITIKPIPKPLDITQPLEIVTTPTTALKLTESSTNESQQSPRIILKINKTTSETISKNVDIDDNVTNLKDLPSNNAINKKSTQIPVTTVLPSTTENELKRTNSIIQTPVDNKRLKLDPCVATMSDEIINLDSDDDNVTEESTISPPIDSNNRHNDQSQISHVQPTTVHHDTIAAQKNDLSTIRTIPVTPIVSTTSITSTITTTMTSTSMLTPTPMQKHNSNSTVETIKPRLSFPGNFFLVEDARPEIPHPLLTHNIERAKLLVSMMNADAEPPKDEQTKNKRSQNVIDLSEGSSSDCIMLGDNGTSLPNSIDFGVGTLNENGQNNADRDSGVDVSNSIKSGADDIIEDVTPIKRGRGRPRKDVVTPAVIR